MLISMTLYLPNGKTYESANEWYSEDERIKMKLKETIGKKVQWISKFEIEGLTFVNLLFEDGSAYVMEGVNDIDTEYMDMFRGKITVASFSKVCSEKGDIVSYLFSIEGCHPVCFKGNH